MTGTPLDLTPFGDLLKAIGSLYWLLMLALVALALWLPKRWWVKLPLAAAIAALFILPVQQHVDKRVVEATAGKARLDAALAHFEMRCKGAGEKISRTVPNVEGVVWMKWRDKYEPSDDADQFKLFDPFGRDCTEQECIEQLLRVTSGAEKNPEEAARRKARYRFVESTDPKTGQRLRYSAAIQVTHVRTPEQIAQYKTNQGVDPGPNVYGFGLVQQPIESYTARYGVTWDDISTREDRVHWIAGGSLKVVDLQSNEVIAERVGYMMDRGLGSKAGFRSPWGLAQQYACPEFQTIGPSDPRRTRGAENRRFITKALQPSTGE
jgi:hypothetical protein